MRLVSQIQTLSDLKPEDMDTQTYYWVLPFGLGDQLFVLGLANHFALQRKPPVNVCFVGKQSQSDLFDFFTAPKGVSFSKIIVQNLEASDALKRGSFDRWETGRLLCIHPAAFEQGRLLQKLNREQIHLLDIYREVLGLKTETPLTAPTAPEGLMPQVEAFKNKYELDPQVDVLISPLATSVPALSKDFWMPHLEAYKQRGKRLWTNLAKPDETDLPGTQGLVMDLKLLFFAERLFGQVLALRSGLCDWLSWSQVPLRVFYPMGAQYPQNFLKSNSLAWAKRSGIQEVSVEVDR